jgi:hypothetical protein
MPEMPTVRHGNEVSTEGLAGPSALEALQMRMELNDDVNAQGL